MTTAEERVLTKHPRGKRGANISRAKYQAVRNAIVRAVGARDLTFTELTGEVERELRGFEGSVSWYVECIKLDLEARGVIERVAGTRPQRLRLS